MEVTIYEDPACSWCWAFEPVLSTFAFEFRRVAHIRRVMGGLRDRPAVDPNFIAQQWKKAESVSGMPFDCAIWKKPPLRTTYTACRAVKAAAMLGEPTGAKLLRRLMEAHFVEQVLIDDLETILDLAAAGGLNADVVEENVVSGRAETLFARDRVEASQCGFGFPTIILRDGHHDASIVLEGDVPYAELLQAVFAAGTATKHRIKFHDDPESWQAAFRVHRRLTFAELQAMTGMEKPRLTTRLEELGMVRRGVFYEIPGTEPVPVPRRRPAPARWERAVELSAASGEAGKPLAESFASPAGSSDPEGRPQSPVETLADSPIAVEPADTPTSPPGSSTTLPGSPTTLPGSPTTLPGSPTTLPGASGGTRAGPRKRGRPPRKKTETPADGIVPGAVAPEAPPPDCPLGAAENPSAAACATVPVVGVPVVAVPVVEGVESPGV